MSAQESSIQDLRDRINTVDQKLVELLNERATISEHVGRIQQSVVSKDENLQVFIPRREREILGKVVGLNKGPLRDESLIAIYREIMSASQSLQQQVVVAFLGPAGTHSHQATLERFGDSVLTKSMSTIADVFTALEQGQATYGVVPFENSTHGAVSQTLDRFILSNLEIRAEIHLTIHHHLMSLSSLHGIHRVYSHPEAFAQCRRFLDSQLPHIELMPVQSTAEAAVLAAKEPTAAAICNPVCETMYGLRIIASNVEDMSGNTTRFLIVSNELKVSNREDNLLNETTCDDTERTLLCFTVDHRQPGALCDALRLFKDNGISLTRIDSRPDHLRNSRSGLWHYVFFVEFFGNRHSARAKAALSDLARICIDLKILGSYPVKQTFQEGSSKDSI